MQNLRATSGKKKDLPVKEIRQMLDDGISQDDVAILFDVSQSTISRCSTTTLKTYKKPNKNGRFCSSCHSRPIAKDNRFLCSTCFCS